MNHRLVIVGGVAGGMSVAARARRLSEHTEIVVLERGPHVSFANCGMPYYLGGEITHPSDLLVQTPESLLSRFRLTVRTGHAVRAIHRDPREVTVADLAAGTEYRLPYDALVLATGAAPLRPPLPGMDRPGHFVLRDIPDMEAIATWIRDRNARRAVLVGGGYIGLEMAEQLHHRGLAVTLAEALPQVMTPLDPEMAAWLHQELRTQGVALHLGDAVAGFEASQPGDGTAASVVVLRSGTRLSADLVILGLGVKPDVGLARTAGLEIGALGGIRTDAQMRTSDPHIWAVGDAVEVRHGVTGAWCLMPLAGPAGRQGRVAADTIFGRPARYPGTFGTAILRLFSLQAACTGANEAVLRRAGIPFQAMHLHPASHAGYYPGAAPLAIKILFSPDTGRLLGGQIVGTDGVDKRIDVLATALKGCMTVPDLAELDLAYAPPFGSARDPVNLAGLAAGNVVAGDVVPLQWHELPAPDAHSTCLLDVRTRAEHHAGAIPGSVNVPLDELRDHLADLPAEREIVVYCQSGQRSYYAARILMQHGFRVRSLAGGFRTWNIAAAVARTGGQ